MQLKLILALAAACTAIAAVPVENSVRDLLASTVASREVQNGGGGGGGGGSGGDGGDDDGHDDQDDGDDEDDGDDGDDGDDDDGDDDLL